jgi:hypothetical protein
MRCPTPFPHPRPPAEYKVPYNPARREQRQPQKIFPIVTTKSALTMAVVQQHSPSRRRAAQPPLTLVKLCTFFGGAFLLLQLAMLKIHQSSSSNNNKSITIPPPTDPILLVGLPRSGSLAFHQYFTCNGKPSAHYCCDGSDRTRFPCEQPSKTCGACILQKMQSHQESIFDDCQASAQVWSQFDVETADAWFLPQHFALGLLHQTYPNATWILNRRGDSRRWAKSVLHWNSMTRRLFHSYGMDLYPHPIPPPPDSSTKVTAEELEVDMAKSLHERVYNRTEYLRKWTLLERIYDNHTATIQAWARQFPSHRLIEIDVDDDASLAILDKAFGYASPGKCDWSFEAPDDDWKDFSLPF